DKVYENIERQHGYKEDDRLGGHDPYSSSKACAELAISAYRRSFFAKSNCKIASARAGNVIGGGDWAKDRLIPDLIRSIYENKKLELRYPNAIRPWQHVLDVCNGYLILAEKLYENRKYEGAYNFAPLSGKSFTVEEIVKMGIGVVGKGKYSISSGSEPSEASILRLDATKAKRLLGWRPKLKIKKALKLTFDWYASFYERNEGREEMEKQIKDYFFIQ
ncbi:MAG: GDP-mannose 4,6-dehydratase, partial [Candidatus Micrarchaeota archaeon]|nr:GDP-mannose 4,6-dehydratase [Candidatus Micrarchaeota archaeon]